jgi:predicted nucleotidyltransferase
MTPDPELRKMVSSLRRFFQTDAPGGIASAYLFGSHAERRAHRESDVDVGVLLDWSRYPTRPERGELRVRLGAGLIHALVRNMVDVVVLNDAPPELARRVVTHGARVFCADAAADHALVRDAQLRAADVDIFLRRMRRIKLDALRR